MNLSEHVIQCPFCWQTIPILVDPSVARQQYIEDCSVCCRPIEISVRRIGEDFEIEAEQSE